MQLPSEILTILERLVLQSRDSNNPVSEDLLNQAERLLADFKPADDQIFQKGRYTDFELMLFQESQNRGLQQEIKKLKRRIGEMDSEIEEWKHTVRLKQAELKKNLNLKKGEREKLLLDANIARLEKKVAKLTSEKTVLNKKLKAKNHEIARLVYQLHRNPAA